MTPDEVRELVNAIRAVGDFDPERAHSMEDELYLDILRAIAAGLCENPKACADEAIKSQDIDFPRWCA